MRVGVMMRIIVPSTAKTNLAKAMSKDSGTVGNGQRRIAAAMIE